MAVLGWLFSGSRARRMEVVARCVVVAGGMFGTLAAQSTRAPNIVLIVADDLGYGELGCYGQTKIRTPNLDRLAAEGLRFTQAYSGAPVCAPARCVLLTGTSSPFAEIRDNQEVKPEGQWPISAAVPTLPGILRAAGYATGGFGKWGLGMVGSTGDPNAKGFDRFFGYNCQRQAHTYYPQWLWLDGERLWLDNPVVPGHGKIESAADGYERFVGREYAPQRILAAAKGFLRAHASRPFFLYLPFVQPHLAMQPPRELVETYPEEWDREPYLGGRGYVPHPRPRAGYAAMISDLDRQVGEVLGLLDELGRRQDTLVIFTSDNGPTHDVGGVDTEFFDSAGGLRGRKGSVYEGGIRVPMIVRWSGTVVAGSTSDDLIAAEDIMATCLDLAGSDRPATSDGVSFAARLTGRGEFQPRRTLRMEFRGYGGQKVWRDGSRKAVLRDIQKGNSAIEVYDVAADRAEVTDLASQDPDFVARAREVFRTERVPSEVFPLRGYDPQDRSGR
ncbi:MAG: arylsulfatase [Planctomycetota bacterium]